MGQPTQSTTQSTTQPTQRNTVEDNGGTGVSPTEDMGTPSPPTKDKSRFTKIETERYMYNSNQGSTKPLVGYLINIFPMPEIRGRDWNAFLVKTTEPTMVINREKQLVEVPPGSEVLIPTTFQLAQHLDKLNKQQSVVFEVSITPKKKIDIGKGQTMWLYEMAVDMKNGKKRALFGPSAMLDTPQMGTAHGQDVAENAGMTGSDDIPF
jgi:hypothetical protein